MSRYSLDDSGDGLEHIETGVFVCPSCSYDSDTERDFDLMFCPSTPDRCDGCEIDPRRAQCPVCGHVWPKASAA